MADEENQRDNRVPPFCCLIAGGGTGGHLFPGIAVAGELKKRFKNVGIIFVVGHRKIESTIVSSHGYRVVSIDVEGLKGRGWRKGVTVLLKLPKSLFQSFFIIRRFSPAFVFGLGGYCAGPVCMAAKLMRIPTAIHEQNSYPGFTSRLLSRFVDCTLVSFEESKKYFKGEPLVLSGNPVRRELIAPRGKADKKDAHFTILVIGGSQGARAINEKFVLTLEYLNRNGRTPQVIHQTGEMDYERVVQDYQDRGLEGELVPFIQDMAKAYGRADLVVSRAGATTIFELAFLGKPSILIPYPFATNQHQEMNARSLVQTGGAEMIHQKYLTGEALGDLVIRYMNDPLALNRMGEQAKGLGRADAAKVIVDHLMEISGWFKKSAGSATGAN